MEGSHLEYHRKTFLHGVQGKLFGSVGASSAWLKWSKQRCFTDLGRALYLSCL